MSLRSEATEVGVSSKNHNSSLNSKNARVRDVDCGDHLDESGLDKILTKSSQGYSINKASSNLRSVAVTMTTPELTGYEVDFQTTPKMRWHAHIAIDHKGTLKHFIVKYANRDTAAQCPRPQDFNEIGRHWRGDFVQCKFLYANDNGFEDVVKSAQNSWCQGKSSNLTDCKTRFGKNSNFAESTEAAANAWCRIRGYGD